MATSIEKDHPNSDLLRAFGDEIADDVVYRGRPALE